MEIQWPLVVYTLLGGLGVGTMMCVAVAEWTGRLARTRLPAAITAFVAIILGGISSILHLGHAERGVNLLGNVTSGLTQEVFGLGFAGLATLVYIWLAWRGSSEQARRISAVVAGVIGVIEAFLFGKAYVLVARPGWNSWLLPLLYFVSAAVLGLFTFYVWVALRNEEKDRALVNKITQVSLVVQAVVLAVYVGYLATVPEISVSRLFVGELALLFWVGAVVVGLLLPAILTAWAQYSRVQAGVSWIAILVVGLLCAGIGGLSIRSLMYLLGNPVALYR